MVTFTVTLHTVKEHRAPNGVCYNYRVIAENEQDALDKAIANGGHLGNIKYFKVVEDKCVVLLLNSYRM